MELEKVLEMFKYLAAPFEETNGDASATSRNKTKIEGPEGVFQTLMEHCLKHVDYMESSMPLLPSSTDSVSSWHLTCIILSLLSKLKAAIEETEAAQTEEEKAISVLSIQSQINVQKSVELVIGFGVVPYLLPGLGVPDKLRKMSPSVPHFLKEADPVSHYQQFLRLSHVLETLLNFADEPSIFTLIIPKYTSDILAGLLQICKAPIAEPNSNSANESLSKEQYENVMTIRDNMRRHLQTVFLQYIPKSSLINSLFLIGATQKPHWISNSCCELLHEIVLSTDGLVMVSTAMLDSSGQSDSWKLMRVISNLMKASLVKCGRLKDRETLRSLSDQCLHLVKQIPEAGKDHVIAENSGNVSMDCESNDKNHPLTSSSNLPYGTNVELLRIGLFCSMVLMEIDPALAKSTFWDRLFHHVLLLENCQDNEKNVDCGIKLLETSKSSQVSAPIQKIALCVTYGELLLSLLKPMNVTFSLKFLQPVWSLFLQIFVACERYLRRAIQEPKIAKVVEQLRHKLRDVLISLFEIYASGSGQSLSLSFINVKPDTSANPSRPVDLCDFCMTLILNQESHQDSPTLNKFDFQCADDNAEEIHVIRVWRETISSSSNYSELYDEYLDPMCFTLSCHVLKSEKLKGHWPVLFRQLLSWGTSRHAKGKIIDRKRKFKSDEMPTHLSGLGGEDNAMVFIEDCHRFITFKLLGELGEEDAILEQFGQSESTSETLGFLELLLNKFTSEACSNSDDSFDSSQLIMYSLGIIGALVEAASAATTTISSHQHPINQSPSSSMIDKEINDMWDNLKCFIPHLRKLTESTQPSLVRQGIPKTASGLLRSIGTRGANAHRASKHEIFKSRLQLAMEDAKSPMVHVKGHGILELRRLIDQGDPDTLNNDAQVLKIFQENLTNDDSYVYLMSIQGMASLALKFHKKVVPILIKEYDFYITESVGGESESDKSDSSTRRMYQRLDTDEKIETRMKVGEILVKVVQKLGGLAPSYRVPLTNVFFRLMRDEEPLIRASALSNLGELCHLLKFSLGIILTEVWYCVQSILTTEKNIHVRRAALHLIVLLLRGVEMEFTVADILGDRTISENLRDVRRFLTQTEQTEVDLIGKTHCQLALQELERIVKKLLTPNTSLEFKIQVLNI